MWDEKSDVYSLGCVLYFILTNDHPWESESSRPAAVYAAHGELPDVSDSIEDSEHPADVAIREAM